MRKNMVRLASLGAVMALALSACSSNSPSDTQTGGSDGDSGEIEFLFWNWGPDAEPGWQSIVEEFESENSGVSVGLTPVAGDTWGTYLANASTMIAGGASPDLIYSATEGIKFLIENDLIAPIDDLLEGDVEAGALIDDMAPQLVDGLRADGQLYALPYAWNNINMYYNTDRFAEEGLDAPASDWTIDEFLQVAKALTVDENGDGTPEQYGYSWDSNELFPGIMPWVLNFGGQLVSDDLCVATIDTPEVVEAVQFLHDLIYVHGVSPAPAPLNEVFPQFQNGTIAMFGAGRWPLASILPSGFESFDIQLYPKGEEQIVEFGVAGFPILQSSENPELAWEFVKFASSKQVQERTAGSAEAPATDIPALRSVAEQLSATEVPPANSELFYDSLEENEAALVPAPASFSEFESILIRYLGLIMADEVSVEEGLAQAQAEAEAVVSCG